MMRLRVAILIFMLWLPGAQAACFEQGGQASQGVEQDALKKIEFLEHYCFDEVNRARRANRLKPLEYMEELLPVARNHSRGMAEDEFFSHTDLYGLTPRERVKLSKIRFRKVGENLSRARGFIDPVPDTVEMWMKNPADRGNILDPEFRHSAVGVWISRDDMVFFTQLFIRKP